jgi:hypothetical protein
MSFAALQTRVNATAIKRLGQSVFVDGMAVTGIFENSSTFATHSQIGYEHTAPTLTVETACVPSPAVGVDVSIGNDDYVVFAHEPDGSGLSCLLLERRA